MIIVQHCHMLDKHLGTISCFMLRKSFLRFMHVTHVVSNSNTFKIIILISYSQITKISWPNE